MKTLSQIARLQAATNPVWTDQPVVHADSLPGPPSDPTDGVDLESAVVALLGVELAADPETPTYYVTIDKFDANTTYTVTIDGVDYDGESSPGTTRPEYIEALQQDITTAGAAGGDRVDTDGDGDVDELRIYTDDDVSVSAAGGTGTISVVSDATSVDFRLWIRSGQRWFVPDGGVFESEQTNWLQRAEVAGCARAYVQVTATDGRVVCAVGPCLLGGV